jgi:hypothetical protein
MGACVQGAGLLLVVWAGGAAAPAAWNETGSLACSGQALGEYTNCMETCGLTCNVTMFARCDVEVPANSTLPHTHTSPHGTRPTGTRCLACAY